MDDIDKSFESLAKALDTTFAPASPKLKKELVKLEEKKNELIQAIKSQPVIKDQDYISDSIKTLIEQNKTILNKLATDIKIGSTATQYIAYSQLSNAVLNSIKQLQDLNKMIAEREMFINPDADKPSTKNITMSASELMEMLNRARKESQLNKVDATFTIEEDSKFEKMD